ncbi:MAG: DedA family protein [Myxococcota bacterium]|nr:DedA family protein [Myxococcota bacterium]
MVEWLDSLISQVGPVAYALLAAAAALEYLVPPFPGDTVVLLGGVYAVRGDKPWWLVFLAVTAGSVLGAAANFYLGKWLDTRMERRLAHKTILGISLQQLHAVEEKMRKRGILLLLLNRFIPGVRGLFFVAAGMSHMPVGKVLVCGAISAAAHTAVVMGLGIALGGNAEALVALVARYQSAALGLLAVVALALAVRFLQKRRAAQ